MNPEIWLVAMPAIGWLLFSLGGTEISENIKGQKWVRRLMLPAAFGLCVFLAGAEWWRAVCVCGVSMAVFPFGYGERSTWIKRILIFSGYGLISAPVGLSWWNLITAISCPALMALSLWRPTSRVFVWKVAEGAFGAMIGIQTAFPLIY